MEKYRRRGLLAHINNPFPVEIVDDFHGLTDFENHLLAGKGGIILLNHFSLRDFVEIARFAFKSGVVANSRFLAPIAYHQYVKNRHFARLAGIELAPLVTPDTIDYFIKHKNDQQLAFARSSRGIFFRRYLEAAKEILGQGGVVAIAPQGGRSQSLGETAIGRPVEASLKASGDNGVIILPVGIGIRGVTDYSTKKIKGFNFGRTYQLKVGQAVTREELIEISGGEKGVDQKVIELLRKLVPEEYLEPRSIVL